MTRWIDGTAIVTWNLCAWVIWGAAIVAVIRTPAPHYLNGWRSKLARLAIITMVSLRIGGLFLPLGGIVILAAIALADHPRHTT